MGNGVPHTAYSAAKFAIKGFSEALTVDFRENAPHVGVSVICPGHIGSKIGRNTASILGAKVDDALFDTFEKYGMPPSEAAGIILDGIRKGKWRILVGKDAEVFDREVRADPENAYTIEFMKSTQKKALEARGLVIPGAN